MLSPGTVAGNPEYTPNLLSWSPDGKRLLAYEQNIANITIWGSELLPQE
jgi:hypothetical protein